jgi:hypothetical protein
VPTDDPRLEQALHDAAPAVETSGVVAQIAHRRTRRRRNRRLGAGALALVALLVVGTVTVLVTRDDGSTPHITSPGANLRARVITGRGAVDDGAGVTRKATPIELDQDTHILRPPLSVGSGGLSIASYDPGTEGDTPSYVVRVDGSHVVDVVDQKARILSIADGEGARWVLTQNHDVTTPGGTVPDVFLKRVTEPGTPPSVQLPRNADPVGPVAAVGGAVWVPLRDGVLQYDTVGHYVRTIDLPAADHRWVAQVGKFAAVTDGNQLHALEVVRGLGVSTTYGPDILGLAGAAGFDGRVLLAAEDGGAEHARVARSVSVKGGTEVTATLPDGFVATGLEASSTRIWATGTVDGAPAIALLGDNGVVATVVLEHAGDRAALAWTDARTVRAVSDGKLYEISLP